MPAASHPPAARGFDSALVEAALSAAQALPPAVPVFAVAGLQGTGKSTFAAQIATLARQHGQRVAVLSLDDVYLTHDQRRRLARDVHPLLATRGPPGTHDVGLACDLIDALRRGDPVALPRFDKLADDRAPRSGWPIAQAPVDLVIMEGWCLGTPAQDDAELSAPLNPLERDDDPDGRWRRYCNDALRRDYPELWRRFDALWFLRAPGFEVVSEWRWQQERQLARERPGQAAMDRGQVLRFIQFFERISRQALRTLPAIADRTIELDADRRIVSRMDEA